MTDRAGLTDRDREILDDPLPPHLIRVDTDAPGSCDYCDDRPEQYSVILGHHPDGGYSARSVCDVCFELVYAPLSYEFPLAARMYHEREERE